MIKDNDVPSILKKDGVLQFNLDLANQFIVNVPNLIERYGTDSSWAHTLINTESNSATLICQMPGQGNRRHHHPDWNEWWYIIQGQWTWELEGIEKNVSQGDIVFIEKNKKHKITAIGNSASIRLAVSRYDVVHVYE
jgi:quercetin dioxygenase-like cupin family protein